MPHPILDSLDKTDQLMALDPLGMFGIIERFPDQCREAMATPWKNLEQSSDNSVRQVVITGLGGSAIGGDYARYVMEEFGSVPLYVNRDYNLPEWVDSRTLVIAASYSGNTEETLSAFAKAKEAGAHRAVISSGGALLESAKAENLPYAEVPGGQPPRTAIGYMLFPTLNLLMLRELLDTQIGDQYLGVITRLNSQKERFCKEILTEANPAKRLAVDLFQKIPIVYGSQSWKGGVAYRWKCQWNENVKSAAFDNTLPEQNHNEILAWTLAKSQAKNWAVVFLREANEVLKSPRIAKRVEVTKTIIGADFPIYEVEAEGETLLEKMFSLTYYADFVTVYLALLNGVCPTEIKGIDLLKEELAKL